MPLPDAAVRVEAIREAARLAVAETSLRAVARAVGLSPMGLSNFLDGRRPYTATLRKLTIWYVAEGARKGAHEDVIRAALYVLLEGLPAKGRERGVAAVLGVVERMHRESRTQAPAWLARLRGDGDTPG
jgi:hypothetical protein